MAKSEMLGGGSYARKRDPDVPEVAITSVLMTQEAWDKMVAVGLKVGKTPQQVMSEAMHRAWEDAGCP